MAENNHSCVSGMISAFFTGALLGAGLALIFAPVTGKEARHTIVQQFDELKEKIKELEKKLHKSGINDSIKLEDEEEVGA
jgi:gas vesicle protein